MEKYSLNFDDKIDKQKLEGHNLPCPHFDGFCWPTLKLPYAIVWFLDKKCIIFLTSDVIGRMSKVNNRY